MTHEVLMLSKVSPQTLKRIVVGGGVWMLFALAFLLFFIWRGKRRDLGKTPLRSTRTRKSRRR